MLISSMIGIAERTTMDIDTTVSGINMEEIEKVIREVLLIDINDDMEFEFNRREPIREKAIIADNVRMKGNYRGYERRYGT